MAQILTKSTSFLKRYEHAAQRHPLATKSATCLVGFAMGDVVAQVISRAPKVPITTDGITFRTSSLWEDMDFMRTLRMALFGALIAAPQMHVFFNWLEKCVMPRNPTHPVAVLSKVAADQCINSPLGTVSFFAWTQMMRGTPDRIGSEVSSKLWTTTQAGWCIWPAAQAVNFLVVPLQFRIVFINAVAIAWTCILSKIGN